MKGKEILKAYLGWIAFTILMLLNLAILAVLGVAELIALPIKRARTYKLAANFILIGIREEAKRLL